MLKKYLSSLALLCILPFTGLHAQFTTGDLTVNIVRFTNHDSTRCWSTCNVLYNITITGSFLGDSVKVIDTVTHMLVFADGNTTGASTWTTTAPIPLITSVCWDYQIMGTVAGFLGNPMKVVSGPDTVGGLDNMHYLIVTDPCEYGHVSGKVYIDNSSDCIYNTGDEPLHDIRVDSRTSLYSPSVTESYHNGWTTFAGTYDYFVQKSWMTNYNVTIPSSYYFIFPPTSCFTGAYTFTTLPQTNVDFPLLCTGYNDLEARSLPPVNIRYNTSFFMHPYVSNIGCDSMSGELTFVKDSRVIYDASLSLNPATTVHGDTLQWNYVNLTNLTNGAYWNSFLSRIHLTPDTSAHVGDTLCFRTYTGVPGSDINPVNNDETICMPVLYSYDPNMKKVTPQGTGTPGYIPVTTPQLTYTLHFQNTGTAPAYDVKIIDTLDADVDPSSLRILSTTHSMVPEWLAPGVVRFNFSGIYLPDSNTNEPASHGAVSFSIKLDAGLAVGTQIKNTGYIYFDANPPVVTNTTLNTLATTLAAGNIVATDNVYIYPNPATDLLYIQATQEGTLSILGIDGSEVLTQHMALGKTTVDVSALATGVYIIKTISKDNTTTSKFIKQ